MTPINPKSCYFDQIGEIHRLRLLETVDRI